MRNYIALVTLLYAHLTVAQNNNARIESFEGEEIKQVFVSDEGALYDNRDTFSYHLAYADFRAWNWDWSFEEDIWVGENYGRLFFGGNKGTHYWIANLSLPLFSKLHAIRVHGFDVHPDKSLRILVWRQSHLISTDDKLVWEGYTDVITSSEPDVDDISFTIDLSEPVFLGHNFSRFYVMVHPIDDEDIGDPNAVTSWETGEFGINHIEFLYSQQ